MVGAVRAHPDVAERAPEGGAHEAAGLLRCACAHKALELRPRLGPRPPRQLPPALSGTHIYDVHIFVVSKEHLSVVLVDNRGDPFITFTERGRGVEKLDQNANAVREVA